MLDVQATPAPTFPDNPLKWEGWGNYKADNPYERLCLDPQSKPGVEQIEQHCTALLQWWHKKLPLKSQPSNPLAQLLGRGIDEAPRFLVQARVQLLDPERRREVDAELASQAQEEALADFANFVAFSVAGKVLTADAEAILTEFGQSHGLSKEQARACIDEQLKHKKARRAAPPPTPHPSAQQPKTKGEREMEFHRILSLSNLDLSDATRQVRQIFITIAENLGIHLERAEDLLDQFLDLGEFQPEVAPVPKRIAARIPAARPAGPAPAVVAPKPAAPPAVPAPPAGEAQSPKESASVAIDENAAPTQPCSSSPHFRVHESGRHADGVDPWWRVRDGQRGGRCRA